MDDQGIAFLKEAATRWMVGAAEQGSLAMRPLVQTGVTKARIRDALSVDLFAGLETAALESSDMKRGTPYLEPRVVDVGAQVRLG